MWTPDADRAAAFYGHVLGLDLRPGDPSGHQHHAAHRASSASPGRRTLFCCYAVADLEGARQAILDGGGTVDELAAVRLRHRAGRHRLRRVRRSRCSSRIPVQPRPELNGAGPGELSYITYEVTDSTAFKAFYSRVLFWTFEPGRIDDGWAGSADPSDGRCRGRQRRSR